MISMTNEELFIKKQNEMRELLIKDMHIDEKEKKIVGSDIKAFLNQPEIWLWSHRRWKHKRDF